MQNTSYVAKVIYYVHSSTGISTLREKFLIFIIIITKYYIIMNITTTMLVIIIICIILSTNMHNGYQQKQYIIVIAIKMVTYYLSLIYSHFLGPTILYGWP